MKYKLIATDMDGTLLNDRQELPNENIAAIKKFLSLGMKVVIATGRMYPSVRRYIQELGLLGLDTYCLCGNGSELYSLTDESLIWQMKLDKLMAAEIYKRIKSRGADVIIFNDNKLHVEYIHEGFKSEMYVNDMELCIYDQETAFDNDISKMIAVADNKTLLGIATELEGWVSGKVNMMFSSPTYLEFFNKDVDKGRGLEHVAKLLGVSRNDVIAAGDSHNDLAMIRYAGLGVAAANAVPELKAAADFTTESDNNTGVLMEIANMIDDDINTASLIKAESLQA